MLIENSITEAQGRKLYGKGAGPNIRVVVNANNHSIPSLQRGNNSSKEVSIKDRAGVRRRNTLKMEVSQMLIPDRTQRSWVPAGSVGREETDARAIFSF